MSGGTGSDPAKVTIALAEYDAVRAEILNSRTAQNAFVGVGLTAIGVLYTLGTSKDADRHLLLAVPSLALAVSLLHLAESYRIHRLGDYIRVTLWPYVVRQVGPDDPPPSWEHAHARHSSRHATALPGAVFDGAAFLLFAAAGLVATQVQAPRTGAERLITYGAALGTVLAPLLFALWLRLRSEPEPDAGPSSRAVHAEATGADAEVAGEDPGGAIEPVSVHQDREAATQDPAEEPGRPAPPAPR